VADSQPAVFPLSLVAERLGVDRRTVRDAFEAAGVRSARLVKVRGQQAQAFRLEDFPVAILERLRSLADRHCYSDLVRFLRDGPGRWDPSIRGGKISPAQVNAAHKRCNVLAPLLQGHGSGPVSELVARACQAWKAATGYDLADRTMRRWIERARDRDRGFLEWSRWEIWLDEDLSPAPPAPPPADPETPRLNDVLSGVKCPFAPTLREREHVWAAAMNDASVITDAGFSEAEARRIIVAAIDKSIVPMAKNRDALREAYNRKRAAWIANRGLFGAVVDRRTVTNKERRFTLPEADIVTLITLARTRGNQLSCAYREAHQRQILTPETLSRFPTLPADKGFVPHAIRRRVSPLLSEIAINGRGPRARRLNGPKIVCDWRDVHPGDVFEFDDLTLPLYWWIEDPESPTGFFFGAGQTLMGADSKTGFILDWVLAPRAGYSSRDILKLVRLVHDRHGLPHQCILFERGIWQRSRLISGSRSERAPDEIVGGLANVWPVKHTYSPTGKAIIERIFGLLQDRMEHIPGYTGRDMRKDCPDATKRAIDAVKAGREHPSKRFLHASQVMQLLEDIAEAYHKEPLGLRTVRIPGQTPLAAWEARDTTRLQKFGPECEHLFSTHRMEAVVTANGIRLPDALVPKAERPAVYRNEYTGTLVGQSVTCWADPFDLSHVFLTTGEGKNPRLVERVESPRARGAETDSLSRAWQQNGEHMRFLDTLTRATRPQLTPADFRPNLVDGATARMAEDMRRQKAEFSERRRDEASLKAEFDRTTRAHGLQIGQPNDPERMQSVVDGLKAGPEHWDEVRRRAQEQVDL
jgi:hypothetical protein